MAGRPNSNNLAGSEGEGFNPDDLEFGDFETEDDDSSNQALSDDEIRQGAEEEVEDDQEQSEADDDGESQSDDDDQYEEEGDDDNTATPPPAAQQQAPPVDSQASQQGASGDQAQPAKALHDILLENEDAVVNELSKSKFALPKNEAESFEDPQMAEFVARNNARTYVKTLASVSQWLHAALPSVVQNLAGVQHDVRKEEETFFSQNEDLRSVPPQQLAMIGNFVRQQKTNWTKQELMDATASAARNFYGMAPPAKQSANNANGKAGGQKRVKTVSRVPFTPAGRGSPPRKTNKAPKKRDPLADINAMLSSDFED